MNKVLSKIGIGQIAFVEKWLETKKLPFKRENIRRLVNIDDKTEAFEIILEKEELELSFSDSKHVPEFLKSGEIKITISLSN